MGTGVEAGGDPMSCAGGRGKWRGHMVEWEVKQGLPGMQTWHNFTG